MNPLTLPLLRAALAAVQRVQDDRSVRVLVMRGAGRSFCVGADLSTFAGQALPQQRSDTVDELLAVGGNPLVLALQALPVPVVCAVHGPVAGGGVGLALAADVVIAARSSFFYLPFVPALGLVPDMGCTGVLLRALGPARTRALMLLGDRLPAEQAAAWGLIWRCVDDELLATEVALTARQLASLPAHAASEVRALMQQAADEDLGAQLAYERARQRALIAGPAFDEGLQAFMARRTPSFPER